MEPERPPAAARRAHRDHATAHPARRRRPVPHRPAGLGGAGQGEPRRPDRDGPPLRDGRRAPRPGRPRHAGRLPRSDVQGVAVALHVLAIDLGTSALKVALVSTAGEVIASEQEECRVQILPGGGAEQDPADWWSQVTRASSRLMARCVAGPGSVAAVSCTAQWSGTVPVDDRGHPVRNAIIWMDSRGAPYPRRVTGGLVEVQGYGVGKLARWIRKSAGIPARSGKDPVAHILWLKHAEPEAYRRARLFLEPKDWLNLRLTGRAAASYDSIALHWVTDNRSPG